MLPRLVFLAQFAITTTRITPVPVAAGQMFGLRGDDGTTSLVRVVQNPHAWKKKKKFLKGLLMKQIQLPVSSRTDKMMR